MLRVKLHCNRNEMGDYLIHLFEVISSEQSHFLFDKHILDKEEMY